MSRILTAEDLSAGGHFTLDEDIFLSSEDRPEISADWENFESGRNITVRPAHDNLLEVIYTARHQTSHCGVLTVAPKQLIGKRVVDHSEETSA